MQKILKTISDISFIVIMSFSVQLQAKEQRVALVIGNADYQHTTELTNTVNDADDMAAALRQYGFEVILKKDADLKEMTDAIDVFGDKLKGGGVGLFFYSGHGAQMKGENYLFPVDAVFRKESDVKHHSVNANEILEKMGEGKTHLNLVFLDACRDNPFPNASKSMSRGLTKMDAPSGTLIAYATAPNNVASDGNERNSPYTKNLLKVLKSEPSIEIGLLLRKVTKAVKEETKGNQEPWLSMSIDGEFYFAQNVQPSSQPAPTPAPQPMPTPAPVYTRPATARQSVEFEMMAVEGGCFMMGSPKKEENRNNNERQHQVCVKGFEIGKYEVTQAQWQAVMGNNPSAFKGDNLPVENVSWHDVQKFIQKLNERTGKNYRLPTEAEWEYAARAETTTPFYTGQCITTAQANYDGNYSYSKCQKTGGYKESTAAVGSYPANPWDLYDMAGNVWEWTCSVYNENYDGSELECSDVSDANARHVLRGGSWISNPVELRSAGRSSDVPDTRYFNCGFRLLRN